MYTTIVAMWGGLATTASLVVSGIVWLVKLDNTVDFNKKIQDQQYVDLKELIETKFEAQDEKFKGIDSRMARVETGIDSLRGIR